MEKLTMKQVTEIYNLIVTATGRNDWVEIIAETRDLLDLTKDSEIIRGLKKIIFNANRMLTYRGRKINYWNAYYKMIDGIDMVKDAL